ncbi:MAG TPA: 30S ribosomal protein S16 [Myxococcales bacterium LLY-WYZ-16_1]|jgi:small subunit ribosomal protein S16|nr:30S ribosomal protein S16 [Myxococcales bacterium LLY-WYZ-16_1]
MIMLRLARTGSKKRPVYHLVAADRRSRRDGRFVENLGYVIPQQDVVVLQTERVDHWLAHGAQPTETAARVIRRVKKLGNTEIKTEKAPYVPPPIKPVEAKAAEPAKNESAAEGDAASSEAKSEGAPAEGESQA